MSPFLLFLTACQNHLTHRFDHLGQRTLGRADITAAATFAALHTIKFLEALHVTMLCKGCKSCRNDMAGTDSYTSAAVNACSLFGICHIILLQAETCGACLNTWYMSVIHGKSHHRTT